MAVTAEVVINMAIQFEQLGMQFYKEIQRHFPFDSNEFKIIDYLKNEEINHLKYFQDVYNDLRAERKQFLQLQPEVQNQIQKIISTRFFAITKKTRDHLLKNANIIDILLFAAKLEMDAINYYKQLESMMTYLEKKILFRIIKEEGAHLQIILELIYKLKNFAIDEDKDFLGLKIKHELSAKSITNYRDLEFQDLDLLNKTLQTIINNTETDASTLIREALLPFLSEIDPELWILYFYDEDKEFCHVSDYHAKDRTISLENKPIPVSSLLINTALDKKNVLVIESLSMRPELKSFWDVKTMTDNLINIGNIVVIPLENIGALEFVNTAREFDANRVNNAFTKVLSNIIRVLSIEREGMNRINEFYKFFTFSASDVNIEDVYKRALQLIAKEIKVAYASIFHLTSNKQKLMLMCGANYLFQDIQFIPIPIDQSFMKEMLRTNQGFSSLEKKADKKMYEISSIEKLAGTTVNSFLAIPIMSEKEIIGEIVLFNKADSFRRRDLEFMDFITREISAILVKRRQIKQLMQIQKEGQFLARYFSPNLLKKIKQGGIIDQEGIEEEITVMFADIRGFTTMSEKMGPRDVVNLLNRYFGHVVSIVLQNDGAIDKFIGDAIFVYWGVPIKHRNDTLLAALTAIAVQDEVKSMKENGMLPSEFNIGIGINKGPAILGNIGSEERLEFTAIGDTINTASRLCGIAEKNEILVAGPVYKDIFFDLEVSPYGKKILTGKTQEVLVYRVDNLKADFFEIYKKAF